MEKHKVLRIVWLLVFLSSGVTWTQETTGAISGTVKDKTGAAVPGSEVVVQNEGTGISRTVETDATGHYSAQLLSLGNYQVTATREGFTTEIRTGIVLTVGREEIVDMSLAVGAVTEKVEVSGAAPLVETTTASLGSLVDDRTIRALPLNGRSYDQLALLQPGVVLTSPGVVSGTPFNSGTADRYSVGGQRSNTNSFLLDGTDVNDQANGAPGGASGLDLGVDTILEFKIFTNSWSAEYGHSMGSVVSAVTRSGTNAFHGTAFEYIRNSSLDAKNYFDVGPSPPPFKRNQFGGVLGGPIKKDKTFFFTGYEGLRQGQGTTLTATVPDALARKGILPIAVGSTATVTVPVDPLVVPYLNLYPLPNGRDFGDGTAVYLSAPTVITNEDDAMVRVDHQMNDKTGIFGRYTFDQDSLNNPVSVPPQTDLSASRRQYLTLQGNSVLSPTALNNVRFAYNRTRSVYQELWVPDPGPSLDFIPGQMMGAISIGGLNGNGTALTALGPVSGNGESLWAYQIFQWGDDLTYNHGRHSLKFGGDVQRLRDNTTVGNAVRGDYTFKTLNTLLAGTPSNLTAGSPLGILPYWGLRQTLYGVYGRDDYRVNNRLALNFGLRWETATDPTSSNGGIAMLPSPSAASTVISRNLFSIGKMNFEPRFGLAWQLTASGKTALRVGGGIYHNQILPYAYWNETSLPPFFGRYSITNPLFPGGYQGLKSLPPTSATGNGTIALQVQVPVDKTPVNDEFDLSLQQQISKNTMIQIAYAGNHSNHLETLHEGDTATPIFCNTSPGCPAMLPGQPPIYYPAGSPRLNPAWAGIKTNAMNGNSIYNSGTVTLRHQSSSGFVGEIFYTYSKAEDFISNAGGSDSSRSPSAILDPFSYHFDWGLSEFNITNAVIANFSYPLPSRISSSHTVLEKTAGIVANGWTLDGIGTFESGLPFTARLNSSVSGDLSTQFAERPNLNPGFSPNPSHGVSAGCPGFLAGTPVGNAKNWYDPCAFSLPEQGTYGNLRRDSIIGPGIEEMNMALEKIFRMHERVNVNFRFEMFNILNHANFGLPATTALESNGAAEPSAGLITYTTTSSRQLQFALRINF